MNRFIGRGMVWLALQVGCIGIGMASDKVEEKPVAADTPQKFTAVAEVVRQNMKPGGRYEFINAADRGKVETDLDQIAALLQKSGSVTAMSEPDRLKLFNIQEHVNGVLTHSDSNRLVCEMRAPVGTHLPVKTCRTVGEIERSRHDSQKVMQDSMMTGSKCAGAGCRGG